MSDDRKYCFDSSAFIDSWRRYYRHTTFQPLWDRIGEFVINGKILIAEEVKKEIGAGNDELVAWFRQFHAYVMPISAEQVTIVTEIVNKYPLVSQYKKPRPYHADPFVVALGKLTGTTVVTYEGKNKSPDHPKVVDLCREYNVNCCLMSDFFEQEGWQFGFR